MFNFKKRIMEKRIQELEWLICHGDHDWADGEMEEVKNGEENFILVNLTCRKCNKHGYKYLGQEKTGKEKKIGF